MDKHIAEWLSDLTKAVILLADLAIIHEPFIKVLEEKRRVDVLVEVRDKLRHYKLEGSDDEQNGSTTTGE